MTGENRKEDEMKSRVLLIGIFMLLGTGCVTKKPVVVSTPPIDICPMPSGYRLESAIATAEQTLNTCPGKLDQVFAKLIEIAKHSPDRENGIPLQELLKRLVKKNKISETYAKNLYQKYFSIKFVSVPSIKTYSLAGEVGSIKKQMKKELALKRIGMVECSDDKVSYERAEAEYTRVIGFLENLALNEEYMKETM